ncbi:MarR family winged helix-turn-helix transcriptional regulator [Antrihabitans sp. YC2-6]|uniref:MarR family winged helix-turn-helix transcriptional regulator n=1 Tax=Antrihabitans sp. YC2-6 TaxID=2799498 RepID=UPI0018F485AF|nr:MarR family transcriptional regulator [Antrihabitans sp. YC2-6]MBJ8345997.1 MarR family transcriptional regulator [Antrihabitans sp. YC2-6]
MDEYADEIGRELIRLQRVRDRTTSQIALAKGGVDPAIFTCLFRLMTDGPMRSGALAEAVYSDPSTVSRQVAQLVERGLVSRQADPVDGRAIVLVVTDAGRALAEQMRRRRNENLSRVIADWPVEDRSEFVRLLGRFVDDYERRRPEMIAALVPQDCATKKEDGI